MYLKTKSVHLSSRSWLATSHFILGFFLFAGHLWHTGRARAVAAWIEKGIDWWGEKEDPLQE